MAKVRNRYWIPKLRKLVKKVHRNCHRRKRLQAMAYNAPSPGYLPTTRTEGVNPFQVIRINFAGPLQYRISRQKEGKANVLLSACRLTRGVYFDFLPNLETDECLRSMEMFIARRGRPELIYFDNGKTFFGAKRRTKAVMKDE